MFSDVTIQRNKEGIYSVYSKDRLIHKGGQPVDKAFVDRLMRQAAEQGYETLVQGNITSFVKREKIQHSQGK